MMKYRFLMLVVALSALLLGAIANAGAAPAQTQTIVVKDATGTFPEFNPCTGAPGLVTVTYNSVFHITTLPNGTFHVTGTETGTFTFEPNDPNQQVAVGRYTFWFGENSNQASSNGTVTFRVTGQYADGSPIRFNSVAHVSVSATGATTTFEFGRCH